MNEIDLLFQKVAKKNKSALNLNKSNIVGNVLCIGKPSFGKSSSERREAEIRYEVGHKIFMLYDAGRMDDCFISLDSTSDFWKFPKLNKNGEIITAKGYPVELLYPVTRNIPKNLPKCAIPFTIPVNTLDNEDIASLTGFQDLEMVKGILNYMDDYINEKTTGEDYVNLMSVALRKSEDIDKIKPTHHGVKKLKFEVFKPLMNEGLLSSNKVSTALNLRRITKDKGVISILVLKHCPKHLWGFLVHYFLNHIYKMTGGIEGEARIKQYTTIMLNEVADLLHGGMDMGESHFAISKLIETIVKQYRTANLFLMMNTQIPQELPDIKNNMMRIYVYNSSVIEVEKAMEIMGISTRTGMITPDEISLIPFLKKGWFFLFDMNGVKMYKQVWTRSRTYYDGDDFYEIYDKIKGRGAYYIIEDKIEELKKEREESKDSWRLKYAIENTEKKEKTITHQYEKKKEIEDVEEEIEEKIDW